MRSLGDRIGRRRSMLVGGAAFAASMSVEETGCRSTCRRGGTRSSPVVAAA
jgi:hypothetical protein